MWPKPMTAAERRRLREQEEQDEQRGGNQRPNEPPEQDPDDGDRCPMSKYQRHRYVVVPAAKGGGTECEFCHRKGKGARER